MRYLPTYEDCIEICNAYNHLNFYESKFYFDSYGNISENVNIYQVSIFNYRLCPPPLFELPIESKPHLKAHEMRGLTFVSGTRYLLLDKFFNLNQTECSQYTILKDLPIKEITLKEDGSLISFVKLPNNKIIARSKGSFISEQAFEANKIYEGNNQIKNLVEYCLNNNIIPIFEYTSPKNRVVVKYSQTNLVLIKLRNNINGEYIPINELPKGLLDGITIVKTINATLDELIEKCETDTGYEGYVVEFNSGKMIKLKLNEYRNLHKLYTEDLHREDVIINLIINEQIDDILCQLEEGDETKIMVNELITIVNNCINNDFVNLKELLKEYNGNKKDFAIKNCKNNHFSMAMKIINNHLDDEFIIDIVKERIINETKYLLRAREWVKQKQYEQKN